MATNRHFKGANGEDREEVMFVDVAAFGRLGEIVQQYAPKGKQLYIEGRLRWDSWEDKQGGGKRSKLSVVAENVVLLGDPGSGQQHPQRQASTPGARGTQQAYDQRQGGGEYRYGDSPDDQDGGGGDWQPEDDLGDDPNTSQGQERLAERFYEEPRRNELPQRPPPRQHTQPRKGGKPTR